MGSRLYGVAGDSMRFDVRLLEPANELKAPEDRMDFTARLAVFEEQKSQPWAAVWDYYCAQKGASVGMNWLNEVRRYEKDMLSQRGRAVGA
jgi:L-rhamnose isomerase